jgi:hypothetical protein
MAATAALLLCSFVSCLGAAGPQDPPATPPRVEWQRNLADALAVQKETGLPLLIATNVDREPFDEIFAKTTYRDPAFVESTRGYVCVIASPDRHTDMDYDALGNRVECPRFGGCTCSEHITIEPELFARFFNGQRVAPRHVGVSKDGKVLFDRFLDQDMRTAIDAIAKHRGTPKASVLAPTTDLGELFRRRDAFARRSLERMWRNGALEERRKLLAAAANASNDPVDLLRAAVRSDDATLSGMAALAMAKRGGPDAVIDIEDALARVTDAEIQKALVARLGELGKDDKAAARLAAHFAIASGGATGTAVGKPWGNPWAKARFDAADRAAVEAELDRCEAALRANAGDAEARLQLAIAQMALADILIRDGGKGVELWFGDALQNAKKVGDAALAAEVQATIAYVSYMTGDQTAAAKAIAGAHGLVNSPRQPDPFLAARFLEVVLLMLPNAAYADAATARTKSQRPELERTLAIMGLLRQRDAASEKGLLAGIGLLEFGGLRAMARARLAEVVQLAPASAAAHERWRTRWILDFGCEAMQKAYAAYVDAAADKPTAEWFAGYGSLVAAEQHTKDQRADVALSAYADAVARFARSAAGNADFTDTAGHYSVLALAGRAELLLARGNAADAAADLLRAADLRPASLDESDGLQRKPRAIAGRVARALEAAGNTELAAKLKPILP